MKDKGYNLSDFYYYIFFMMFAINMFNGYMLFKAESKLSIRELETQVKEMEHENNLVNQNFLNLASIIQSGIMLIGEYGSINYVNKYIESIFDEPNLLNNKVTNIKSPALKKIVLRSYGREIYLEKTIYIGDKHYRVYSTPFFEENQYIGCLLLASNVTDLVNAKKLQKDFMADV